jgi:hypothetical protein
MTNKNYIEEVIIIENDSPDKEKTQKICQQYSKKLNIKFINNNNAGFGKSCNLGANISSSELILFLNPDTELQKNSLKILTSHMVMTKADIIGGKAINYENYPHGSVVRAPNLFIGLFEFSNLGKIFNIQKAHRDFYYEDKKILNSDSDIEVDAVSGAYLLISRKAYKILHGFDENIFMYLEDVDLGKRANDAKMKVLFCPHSVIWHIGGASSKNKYKIRHQAWFDSRKYYFKKHFGLLTNLIIQPLYTIEEFLLKTYRSI